LEGTDDDCFALSEVLSEDASQQRDAEAFNAITFAGGARFVVGDGI